MAQLSRPQLRVGGLSQKVYVVTHGKEKDGMLEATRKYDVQDQFEAVAHELGWSPPEEES